MSAAPGTRPAPPAGARPDGGDPVLLERGAELEAIAEAMTAAAAGRGEVLVIEAPAGHGRTVLLDRVATLAAAGGAEVRRAVPAPLERDLPYGVVRALLEAPLRAASEPERERLLAGAAGYAGQLLLGGLAPGADAAVLVAHSVHWLCAALSAERPLVLLVDDAQWADRPSLDVLGYLARRVEELPVVLAVAARTGDPDAPRDALSLLSAARAATVLRPEPLSVWGAVALLRRHAPDTSLTACRELRRATGGSPWLLDELGRQLAWHGDAAPAVRRVTRSARDAVRLRLAGMPPAGHALAAAVAVIGDTAPPHALAALAGVDLAAFAPLRDALGAAGLLAPGGGRFAHPLLAAAVAADLPPTERERLHREAACLLAGERAAPAAVAAHLLECGPHGDPEVTRLLAGAADDALRRDAPREAVAFLARAAEERAAGDDEGLLRARLAFAAADAELPDARECLYAALDQPQAPERRVDLLTRLAGLQSFTGDDDRIEARLAAALEREDDRDARAALDVAALDLPIREPRHREERVRRLDALGAVALRRPALARAVIAQRAWQAVESDAVRAEACAALALHALRGDVLLAEAGWRSAYHRAVRVLLLTDRHDDARRAIGALRDAAGRSVRLRALAAWHAAELALRTGDLHGAEHEARAALDLLDDRRLGPVAGGALVVLVRALTEQGAWEDATLLLGARDLDAARGVASWEVAARHARARLWLETGDYERAAAEARAAGALCEHKGCLNPTWLTWRSTVALALAHAGRRDEAAALADEDVERAQRFGAPAPLVTALHARAVAEAGDDERIALCRRALEVAGAAGAGLDAIRVRLELGATVARLGGRTAARELLRPALTAADAAGAATLADRARRELAGTGVRPRRAATEGAAALTPRQLQICRAAGAGKGNREIAQALFLSIKTVETHLAAAYEKLGIRSRAELAAALDDGAAITPR